MTVGLMGLATSGCRRRSAEPRCGRWGPPSGGGQLQDEPCLALLALVGEVAAVRDGQVSDDRQAEAEAGSLVAAGGLGELVEQLGYEPVGNALALIGHDDAGDASLGCVQRPIPSLGFCSIVCTRSR